ncbi:MAG TPA: hypothetical protein PKC98_05680, partial [Candidatus Melainabacteria bacterium]|nr:hypothetical protein [Candidatus Melainabacteria bacterium]
SAKGISFGELPERQSKRFVYRLSIAKSRTLREPQQSLRLTHALPDALPQGTAGQMVRPTPHLVPQGLQLHRLWRAVCVHDMMPL